MKKIFLTLITAALLVAVMNSSSFADSARDASWLSNPANMSPNIKKATKKDFPIGSVIAWPYSTLPSDGKWLECNGQSVDAETYPEFVSKFGSNVPDYKGFFLRGLGGNSAGLNVMQAGKMIDHRHVASQTISGLGYNGGGYAALIPHTSTIQNTHRINNSDIISYDRNTEMLTEKLPGTSNHYRYWTSLPKLEGAANGADLRPDNKAVLYIIKVR